MTRHRAWVITGFALVVAAGVVVGRRHPRSRSTRHDAGVASGLTLMLGPNGEQRCVATEGDAALSPSASARSEHQDRLPRFEHLGGIWVHGLPPKDYFVAARLEFAELVRHGRAARRSNRDACELRARADLAQMDRFFELDLAGAPIFDFVRRCVWCGAEYARYCDLAEKELSSFDADVGNL